MPSKQHENLIDFSRWVWFNHIVKMYGDFMSPTGVLFILDHKLRMLALEGLDISGNWPDFYLNLNDGHGPILGEVGEMDSARWGRVICADGLPIRVLRIGFDYTVGVLNPRFTEREIYTIRVYQDLLIQERLRVHGA